MMIHTKLSTTTNDICTASKMPKTRLADDYQPNSYTVLCGRGKVSFYRILPFTCSFGHGASSSSHLLSRFLTRLQEFFNYTGNRRFRVLVDMHLERYSLAETKSDKTRIVCEVVHKIRASGGGFCKQDSQDGAWYEVGDSVAREKVGALFRDCLFNMYKSSSKAKTAVRRQRRARGKSQRCRGGNSSSSGSVTDSMTDSSEDSSKGGGAYEEQCCPPAKPDMEPIMNVKEVSFSLNEHDLQPLLYSIEYDLDEVAAFDFSVEV